jgi:hypothetical protein
MAYVDWMIRTRQIGTCGCDYGCSCEFTASPTRLPWEAEMASASFWCRGELGQNYDGRYTAMSYVTYRPSGIIVQQIHPESWP